MKHALNGILFDNLKCLTSILSEAIRIANNFANSEREIYRERINAIVELVLEASKGSQQ